MEDIADATVATFSDYNYVLWSSNKTPASVHFKHKILLPSYTKPVHL